MKRNPVKLYVIGNGANCQGYSNWLPCDVKTEDISKADFCLGIGGADVSAKYYNQPHTYLLQSCPITDAKEFADYKQAIALKKPIIGICKGSQWGSVLAGGSLFQDVHHPSRHPVRTIDGEIFEINSGHHNMADLSPLTEHIDYKLLAWANNLSSIHIDGLLNNRVCMREPEVTFYPKINFLGFQNHNESICDDLKFQDWMIWSNDVVDRFLNNKL